LSVQQLHTLNEVRYLADRDVDMTWFQKMTTEVSKSQCHQCFTVPKNMRGCFKYLFISATPRTVYQPYFWKMSF